ncbi:MAG: hypothetical protein U0704_06355 [Candidatus Eisenbacteria bacterium]
MEVSYTAPLRAAWARMKQTLFARPFPIEAWFVIGFSAWLADIFANMGGGFGSSWRDRDLKHLGGVRHVDDWALQPAVLTAFAAVLCLVLVVVLVLSWVSARAQFVFLDNVVHGRAAFTAPWKRSGRLGRSLFLWYAGMSFTWLVPLACVLLPAAPYLRQLAIGASPFEPAAGTVSAGFVAGLLAAVALAVVLTVVYSLNDNFVIPLMWKYDEGALAAWRRFGPLLWAHLGDFGAFVVFALLLLVVAFVTVVLGGLLTCCVGLVLAAIPYVGIVLMLPIYFAFRALGPEFLRQYGPEWDVWAPNAAHAGDQPPPA